MQIPVSGKWLFWAVVGAVTMGVLKQPFECSGQESATSVGPGAKRNFSIHSVQVALPVAPDYQLGRYGKRSPASWVPTKWLRLEMDFDSDLEWADNVEVRWYLQIAGEEGPVVLTGSVLHGNVQRNPRGQRHWTAIFMRPRAVERHVHNEYSVKLIAVQILHNGRLEDTWTKGSRERWWEQSSPVRGLLVDVTQTPFYAIDGDRYEEVQLVITR